MWKAIKQPWHGMRMMRLILGIMLVVQAIQLQQYLFIVAGVVLIVLPSPTLVVKPVPVTTVHYQKQKRRNKRRFNK